MSMVKSKLKTSASEVQYLLGMKCMEELGDWNNVVFAGTLLESVGHTIIPMKVTIVTFYADFAMSSYYIIVYS